MTSQERGKMLWTTTQRCLDTMSDFSWDATDSPPPDRGLDGSGKKRESRDDSCDPKSTEVGDCPSDRIRGARTAKRDRHTGRTMICANT